MLYLLLGSFIVNCVQGMFGISRSEEIDRLNAQVEYLESRIPKHDAKGRFTKKA